MRRRSGAGRWRTDDSPKIARSDSDCGLDTSASLLRDEDGESCQISCPCPEKLSAPEPVRFDRSTGETCESAGGNPITVVRGAAAWPCKDEHHRAAGRGSARQE